MTITLQRRHSLIETECDRKQLARWAATVFMMREAVGLPHMPMDNNTYFWSIDSQNDYWILFDEEDNRKFYLRCREEHQQDFLEAFARFFAYKTKSVILD